MYLRFEYRLNLNCQCATCNQNHKVDQSAYERYLWKKHGRAVPQYLRTIAAKFHTFKWSIPELQAKIAEMENILEEAW
jgi:hypothetical protein